MTSRTRSELERRLEDPGFTPSRRDLLGLLEILRDVERPTAVVRALARLGEPALDALEEAARGGQGVPSVPALRALRRLDPARAGSVGLALLTSSAPDARREAARAVRSATGAAARDALRERLAVETDESVLRAIVESLGMLGDQTDLARVRGRAAAADLGPFADRALLKLGRGAADDAARATETAPDAPLEREVTVALRARPGFEGVLVEELAARLGLRAARYGAGPLSGSVVVRTREPATLAAARVWYELSIELSEEGPAPSGGLGERVVALLARELPSLRLRHRLELHGGKRRADVTRAAAVLTAAGHPNDPSSAPWTLRVDDRRAALRLSLVPRLGAERFSYRRRDLPAASHPTVAAALARIGGVREDDLVWDPFVGSGLELRERDLLGPAERLVGTDTSDEALAAAAENLAGARAPVELRRHDARDLPPLPRAPTLIVTNPPLGRRVARGEGHRSMLLEALERFARVLAPGGRLVWLSPFPKDTRDVARALGLALTTRADVDLDGIAVELQAFDKPGPLPAGPTRRPV